MGVTSLEFPATDAFSAAYSTDAVSTSQLAPRMWVVFIFPDPVSLWVRFKNFVVYSPNSTNIHSGAISAGKLIPGCNNMPERKLGRLWPLNSKRNMTFITGLVIYTCKKFFIHLPKLHLTMNFSGVKSRFHSSLGSKSQSPSSGKTPADRWMPSAVW